jgi:hypothetical protein
MIGVTGASSEIGRGVLQAAQSLGVEAVPIGRSGGPGTRFYDLREPIPDELLDGVQAIVHLAWAWREAPEINIEAGKRLACKSPRPHSKGHYGSNLSSTETSAGSLWRPSGSTGSATPGIDLEFVQDNHSRSRHGILRGMHFQPGRRSWCAACAGRSLT